MKEALRLLYPEIKQSKAYIVLIVACIISISNLELLIPKIIQLFVDDITTGVAINSLRKYFTQMIVAILIVVISKVVLSVASVSLSEKTAHRLILEMNKKLTELGIPYYHATPTGYVLTLFTSGIDGVRILLQRFIPDTIKNITVFMIGTVYLIEANWHIVVLMIVLYLPLMAIRSKYEILAKEAIDKQSISKVELDKSTYDSINGYQEFRINDAGIWIQEKVSQKLDVYVQSRNDTIRVRYKRGMLYRVIIAIAVMCATAYSAFLLIRNEMSLGQFLFCFFCVSQSIYALNGIAWTLTEQNASIAQIRRIVEFFQIKSQALLPDCEHVSITSLPCEICLENVSFSYKEGMLVLKNISLIIKQNTKVAFFGKTGSGKSTIAHLIAGLYSPSFGSAKINGKSINEYSQESLSKLVSYVFQEPFVFNLSIEENISFGTDAKFDEIIKAAQQAGIHEFISELPLKYNTLIDERGVNLSGGQVQRIVLARALLRNAPILILDEVTSSLDLETEQIVTEAIQSLSEKIIIAISHRPHTLKNFDIIYVFEDGKLKENGSYSELIQNGDSTFFQIVNSVKKEN